MRERYLVLLTAFLFSSIGCAHGRMNKAAVIERAEQYDVRILRDIWGVPHVFGKTDADASFGLAYAHAEDDFSTLQDTVLAVRGRSASVMGPDGAAMDYGIQALGVWDWVNEKYETDLSEEVREVIEAYIDGVNYYAALHPDEVKYKGLFPGNPKDLVAGFILVEHVGRQAADAVGELFGPERKREISKKSAFQAALETALPEFGRGSNGFAVSPKRSSNGQTFLACNSHQPYEGPETWYEAHVHSEEGWNVIGGVFPGLPFPVQGHNEFFGWGSTANSPDHVDTYVLDVNPDNPDQYHFDGEWKDFRKGMAKIEVKLWGPISWTFKRELLWSVHGPAFRQPHGTYAVRWPGMGDIFQIEQAYRTTKIKSFDEWIDVLKMPVPSGTTYTYADRDGNIGYFYHTLVPIRAKGYDWKQYLPGDTSETLWTEYLPFEKLPNVINPESGFVINCNNTPFRTTNDPENPNPEDYPDACGFKTSMNNRALRALELWGSDESITEEEFWKYKYDLAYSRESDIAKMIQRILKLPEPDEPLLKEAIDVMEKWDYLTNKENTSTAIAVMTWQFALATETEKTEDESDVDLVDSLRKAAETLIDHHGKIEIAWGEVNRLRRGVLDLPLDGGPSIIRATWGRFEDGRYIARQGDCLVFLVTWDKDGKLNSQVIHQYGSATLDETSPHYADQAPVFAEIKMRPVWMNEDDIRANLEREYQPGEEMSR